MKKDDGGSKLVVIGTGRVGSTFAYAAMIRKLVSEIVLVDINKEKAKGEVMDLNHAMSLAETLNIRAGDYKDCKGADYIVITAGASQKPGETRLDLVKKNTAIMKSIVPSILKYNKKAKFIIVSNPVDILTYAFLKISKLPRNQVFGSGTTLDTSRFKFLLGKHFGVSPDNVHGYIIGEHGDSEVAVFSSARIASIPLNKMKGYNARKMKKIFNDTKMAAYEIIKRKKATHYAIALVITEIIEAMNLNQHKIFPLSVLMKGEYGVKDVALSVPCKIGANGIEEVYKIPLNASELKAFKKSAVKLKKTAKEVGF